MSRKERRSREPPSVQNIGTGSFASDFEMVFGSTQAGIVVNERTALQMAPVLACVRLISETIAALPLHVYERSADGGKTQAVEHPLFSLLHNSPNPEMTAFEFFRCAIGNTLMYGNFYAEIVRNGLMEIVELVPLNSSPSRMRKARKDGNVVYYYKPDNSGEEKPYSRRDILHIRDFGLDGLLGISRVAMAKNAIGLALAAQQHGADFFANGAAPGGALLFDGVITNQDEFQREWDKKFKGPGKRNKLAFLEKGVKYQQIGANPEDAQLLQMRKYQLAEISRIFNVPLHMIGDLEKSSFSNIEQQALEFAKYTITPWLVNLEQLMDLDLFSKEERKKCFTKFNMDALLRGDFESRMKGYAIALGYGIDSVNEVRLLEDKNPISAQDGGDLHLANGNVVPLKDAGAAYKRAGNSTGASNHTAQPPMVLVPWDYFFRPIPADTDAEGVG